MAAFLLLVPQVLLTSVFGFYAHLIDMPNVGQWLVSIEVQMKLMLIASPLTAALVILFTRTFGTSSDNWQSILLYLSIKSCSKRDIITWVLASIALWVLMALLGVVADLPEEEFMLMVRDSNTSPLLIFIVICVFAPVVEELVFRGFLFRRFQQTWLASTGSLIVTCALFTLVHGAQYTLVGLVFILIIAVYLALIRWKTRNTSLCIIAHATNNALSMVALYYFY